MKEQPENTFSGEQLPAESADTNPEIENFTANGEIPAQGCGNATESGEMKSVEDISKRKKKNRWSFLLTVVLFGCVVYALWTISNTLSEGNTTTIYELFSVVEWRYILIALAVMLFMMLCDVLKYGILTRQNGCKLSFGKQAELALTGKYYSAITPSATGGQPMQIYYMYRQGISGAQSSAIVLMNYAFQMFSSAIVAAVIMISCMGYLSAIGNVAVQKTILISGWVGFGINACAPVFITIIIIKPAFLKWLVNLGLVLLHKIHLLKNIDERREKIYKGIDDFAICSKFIFAHPFKFIQLVLLGCVEPLTHCLYSYLVLLAFCGNSIENSPELLFTVSALAVYASYAVVYIPTPGNAGAYETIFMLAFASISGDVMFWLAIISRFFDYYVYIIMGLVMNGVNFTSNCIKRRREKKNAKQTD